MLLATDGQSATDATATITSLIARQTGCPVQVVAALDVHEPMPTAPDMLRPSPLLEATHQDALAHQVHERLDRVLDSSPSWSLEVRSGAPYKVITDAARKSGASLLVIGRGQRRAFPILAGEELPVLVARHASAPVLIVPPELYQLPRVAIVAMDFGAASVSAARAALRLLDAKANGARRFILLHVNSWMASGWDRTDRHGVDDAPHAERLFARVEALLAPDVPAGVTIEHRTATGDVSRRLLAEAAEADADLVAVGTHGRGFIERLFLGSVAVTTLRNAATAVLIAPTPPAVERVRLELDLWEQLTLSRPNDWAVALDLFSRRNAGRDARLETTDAASGSTWLQVHGYQFDGASWDACSRRISLDFSSRVDATRHVSHALRDVQCIEIIGADTHDHALLIEDASGYGVVTFHG